MQKKEYIIRLEREGERERERGEWGRKGGKGGEKERSKAPEAWFLRHFRSYLTRSLSKVKTKERVRSDLKRLKNRH